MHARAWIVVRWFGFLAVGIAIAVSAASRFHRGPSSPPIHAEGSAFSPLVAESPRPWLAPDPVVDPPSAFATPPSLVASTAPELPASNPPTFDPTSPDADRAIDELGEALAGFDAKNVRLRSETNGGSARYVFSCEIPTVRGSEAFVGEGLDPESAARDALSRIRAWAAAPTDTLLR